jgi:hypothetical protein
MAYSGSSYSDSESDGGNISPDLSDLENCEEDIPSHARSKRSACTDRELDDLFSFDLRNSKKKRPRAPSDNLDKDYSSKQGHSSLFSDHDGQHHKKTSIISDSAEDTLPYTRSADEKKSHLEARLHFPKKTK